MSSWEILGWLLIAVFAFQVFIIVLEKVLLFGNKVYWQTRIKIHAYMTWGRKKKKGA